MMDHESSTPVYRQVANVIAKRIKAGDLKPGRPVPSETAMRQESGVARGTARKAIALLCEQGLVHTVVGKAVMSGQLLPHKGKSAGW